jgi:hypothetical protein
MGERGGKRGKGLGGLNQSREREQRGEETKGRGIECEGTGSGAEGKAAELREERERDRINGEREKRRVH